MKRIENYFLPDRTKDLIETLLLENYFSIPVNERLVLVDVWSKAHFHKISIKNSWQKQAVAILTEIKSAAKMKVLCFTTDS